MRKDLKGPNASLKDVEGGGKSGEKMEKTEHRQSRMKLSLMRQSHRPHVCKRCGALPSYDAAFTTASQQL